LLLVGAGYLFYVYNKLDNTVDIMHDPLDRDDNPERQKELDSIFKDKNAVNILLLGVDERDGDKGRSDTIILLSLNPKTNATKMLSVPRDTYVNIPGHGMDKINHAYAYGDVELSIQTFEEAFDLPVHFYARMNMEGFEDGIDALGGVTIQNDFVFVLVDVDFLKGSIHLISYTYVNIPGHGIDKINHAYAYGDVELSIQTFEEAFDLPVHFYARINMEGFEDGIDALGGVTIQNDFAFEQDDVDFPKGSIHL